MNAQQRTLWVEKLLALEQRIAELKADAAREFHRPVGSHPLVSSLAALESVAWATRDAIDRFPIENEINQTTNDSI
ncbi:MAG TPA: hypothetical protein VGO57_09555 [Verrucomicrobiae bacterium]|jgi:hypothetical protein